MSVTPPRVLIRAVLPIIVAGMHVALDKTASTRARKLEIVLLYLCPLGVVAKGLGGFFGHAFISDIVAESMGWPARNPFQLEVGFANLSFGTVGIVLGSACSALVVSRSSAAMYYHQRTLTKGLSPKASHRTIATERLLPNASHPVIPTHAGCRDIIHFLPFAPNRAA